MLHCDVMDMHYLRLALFTAHAHTFYCWALFMSSSALSTKIFWILAHVP